VEIKQSYKLILNTFANGKIITFYEIPPEEAQNILENYKSKKLMELGERKTDVYELRGGYILQVIVINEIIKHAILFTTIEDRETYYELQRNVIEFKPEPIRYFKGEDGVYHYKYIIKTEALSFLQRHNAQLENEMELTSGEKRKEYSFKDTSHILIDIYQEEFLLFDSRFLYQAYRKYKADEIAAINIYGRYFTEYIDSLIQELSENLQISKKILNGSLESLSTLDQQLAKENLNDLFFINNFLGLSAYLGEVMVQNMRCRWGFEEEYPHYPTVITERGYRIPIMIAVRNAINPDSDEKIPSLEMIYSRYKRK